MTPEKEEELVDADAEIKYDLGSLFETWVADCPFGRRSSEASRSQKECESQTGRHSVS